jgi:hypothetical protein
MDRRPSVQKNTERKIKKNEGGGEGGQEEDPCFGTPAPMPGAAQTHSRGSQPRTYAC